MAIAQLQRSRPQQAGARPQPSHQIQPQGNPVTFAQTTATNPNKYAGLGQYQNILPIEKQSQEIVQDLINAAIGCITYLRGLIPEKSFCDLSYGGTSNGPDGRNNAASVSQESDKEMKMKKKRESGTRIKSIQRGLSSEADTLLDLVEQGIFDALRKGYLRAFQLAIFLDLNRPEHIQEAYTFSINYRPREPGESIDVKNIAMSTSIHHGTGCDQSAELLEMTQINRSVRALIRRLIVVTQNLDVLPETRYLTIRLYHTSDAPLDWTPPMFTLSTGKPLWFDGRISRTLSDEVFGAVETGLHSAQIRVTSGKRSLSDTEVDASNSEEEILHPPKRNCHGGLVGAHEFIDFATPHEDHPAQLGGSVHLFSQDSVSSSDHPTPIEGLLKSSDRNYRATTENPVKGPEDPKRYQPEGVLYSDEVGEREFEQDLTLIGIEKPRGSPPTSQVITQFSAPAAPLRLGSTKLDELKRTIGAAGLGIETVQAAEDSQIMCECGVVTENMDTIQCDLCDRWQHCECYGFFGDSDPRIGSMHACYTCLLGENESHILQQMKSFTIARRVIRCLMRNRNGRTFHDIMKTIGIESPQQSVVTGILEVLIEKGYIYIFNPRKVATKRSPNKYKIVETEDTLRLIEDNLLDPLVNISHHYDISDNLLKGTSLGLEPARRILGSSGLQFESALGADIAMEPLGAIEPIVAETPRLAIKTSDTVNHLKAGNWS